jgi:hypothetical protein
MRRAAELHPDLVRYEKKRGVPPIAVSRMARTKKRDCITLIKSGILDSYYWYYSTNSS